MRTSSSAILLFVLTLLLALNTAEGAVFQYSVPVLREKGESTAFLWIPPEAQQVRGVLMAGMTSIEQELVRHPRIRQACAEQQLAIVFLKAGLASANLQKVLEDLARVSGYQELPVAPLMFAGHSAGGPQAKDLAVKMSARCFALVQTRGGGPYDGEPVPAGIPTLMMVGQYDEFGGTMRNEEGRESWERSRDGLAGHREKNPDYLSSMVIEPGAGHFGLSERSAEYLAMFIKKAAEARIPAEWPVDSKEPVKLQEIDVSTGWLTDLTIKSPGASPALVDAFKGEVSKSSWHFDKELAEATMAYHVGMDKKDQFIKWNDPHWVDAGVRFFFTQLKWIGDGQTFQVDPVYAEKYPGQHNNNGPIWPQAGEPVGNSGTPIKLKRVSGPITPVGDNAFRMQFDGLSPAGEGARVTFQAFGEGNDEYRRAEQVGMMPRGFNGLPGKDQQINFPAIGNLKMAGGAVELKANSDSGLPVEYYVAHGPAKIENGRLEVAETPARATFPIEVKVVAYQFGSGVEPKVKTAQPVEQTIQIEK